MTVRYLAEYLPATAGGTSLTPGVAALTLTTYAPTVAQTANVYLTPTTKALTLTTYAPTVARTVDVYLTPTTAALALTTYAPTLEIPGLVTDRPVSLAGGRWYTLHKGKPIFGNREQIESFMRQLAREHAEEDERAVELGEKPPARKVRVVEPGRALVREAPKAQETTVSLPAALAAEADTTAAHAQAIYLAAYREWLNREKLRERRERAAKMAEERERQEIVQALNKAISVITPRPATMRDLEALERRILAKLK